MEGFGKACAGNFAGGILGLGVDLTGVFFGSGRLGETTVFVLFVGGGGELSISSKSLTLPAGCGLDGGVVFVVTFDDFFAGAKTGFFEDAGFFAGVETGFFQDAGFFAGVETGFFAGAETGFFAGAETGFFAGVETGFFAGVETGLFAGSLFAGVGGFLAFSLERVVMTFSSS
mgnify:CR=1 FL=1